MADDFSDDDDFEDIGNPRRQLACVRHAAEDEDEDEDEEAHASTLNPRRAPRKDVKKPGSKPRTTSETIDYGFDEQRPLASGSEDVVLAAIASVGKETGAPFLKPTPWKPERKSGWNKGWQTRDHRCSFWNESDCRYKVTERRKLVESDYLHEAYKPGFGTERGRTHADHRISYGKSTLPKYVRLKVASPSKLISKPQRTIEALTDGGIALDKKAKTAVRQLHKREKKEQESAIVPAELRGTVGGMHHFLQAHSRERLTAAGTFGIHSTYVIGEPVIDMSSETVFVALSTVNLLLNMYRQSQYGVPPYVCMDNTYRTITDGHSIMLFGTTGPDQRFHAFGYGLCSREDQEAHSLIWQSLVVEAERVVAEYAAEGWFI